VSNKQSPQTESQPRGQVMNKNTIFVGVDVYKNSIDVALALMPAAKEMCDSMAFS
jgi:hypothetical protein